MERDSLSERIIGCASLTDSRAALREKYVPPKAHRCDPEWLEALDERHRQLHLLAQEKLGSSYFADRTHGISKVIKTLKETTNKK